MLHIDGKELFAQRERAKLDKYQEAEQVFRGLPAGQLFLLLFGPVKVGDVTFKHDGEPDTQMDLYFRRCQDGHATLNYQNGMPGENLRIQCHCGNRYYFSRVRQRLSELPSLIHLALLIRRKRARVRSV